MNLTIQLTLVAFSILFVVSVESRYAYDVVLITRAVAIDLFKAWQKLSKRHLSEAAPVLPILQENEQIVFSKVDQVSRKLDDVYTLLQSTSESTLKALRHDLTSLIKEECSLNLLLNNVREIEAKYKTFKDYLALGNDNKSLPLESYTLEDFAKSVLSAASYSVRSMADKVHEMTLPYKTYNKPGLFKSLAQCFKDSRSYTCQINQSPQQFLHNLYSSLQITQLRAYIMMQFSWMILKVNKNGNFQLEAEKYRRTFLERATIQAISVKNALQELSNSLWKCDPIHHIPGETYTELNRFLQGFVLNEVDMNGDSTCRQDCGYYQSTRQHGCYKNQFCSRQPPCTGNVVNCQFVDSDMWICQANPLSNRRYEYVQYESKRVLGQLKPCEKLTTKVDSWWRWLFWHCSYCLCLCDDHKHKLSDRYFNLRPTISDIENNKVVTGIKFVKKNRIIHLQIQQGKFQERGAIDPESVEWVPVDNYQINDPNVKEEIDYFKMDWNQRALNLDDLVAPKNHVITGVRFKRLGTHLNLEILASMFNFTSGKLLNKTEHIGNQNIGASKKSRTELHLSRPDIPTRTIAASVIDSTTNQFIKFTSTDLDKDAAQTAVPFFDIQAVAPEPSVPLSGIGIAHKGQPGFGGFITLKVFTYNIADHVQDTLTLLSKT